MERRAVRFRRSVAEQNRGRKVRRRVFTEAQRQEALSYLAARRAQGATIGEAASELGLGKSTLENWRQRSSSFVAVETAPELSAAGIAVVSPSGYRVEGLSLEQTADLLGRLG